jgi:hypothetical protein
MSETATPTAEAPAPAPAAPASAPAVPAAPAAAPASVLATGATPSATPPQAQAPGPNDWIPEKHRVSKADGTFDLEASARKVAEAHGHLEKRMGSGDAPPATADAYKINVPESLAEKIKADDLSKNEDFKAFLSKLHAAGASQKVADAAVSELLERGMKMRETAPVIAAAEAEASLRQAEGWKTDAEYSKRIGAAFQAGKAYGGPDFDGILKDYGNDPRVIRLLANVGAEMAEDTQASPEAQAQLQDNLDTLMSSKAYLNDRDPAHAATFAKVSALQSKLVGSKEVATGRTMSFKSG